MQEWFVGERCRVAGRRRFASTAPITPGPRRACSKRCATADTIVICPSNPVISIGPILAVPGIRDALVGAARARVAISPIVGGAPVKGPADRLMAPLGHRRVVRRRRACVRGDLRRARDRRGRRAARAAEVEAAGVRAVVTDTMMRSPEIAAALARARSPPSPDRIGADALTIIPIDGIGEIQPGDELAELIARRRRRRRRHRSPTATASS